MTVIKLWKGFGPDKEVQFTEGGDIFVLPPDLPADLYFEVMALEERRLAGEDLGNETLKSAHDQLLELCRYRRPDLERVPCTLSQLVTGVAAIYGDGGQQETEEDSPPARPSARKRSGGATRSGKRPPRTRPQR